MKSQSLKLFKRCLDGALRNTVYAGLDISRIMVRLDHLKSLVQPKSFYDSVILR